MNVRRLFRYAPFEGNAAQTARGMGELKRDLHPIDVVDIGVGAFGLNARAGDDVAHLAPRLQVQVAFYHR